MFQVDNKQIFGLPSIICEIETVGGIITSAFFIISLLFDISFGRANSLKVIVAKV
jgi:hypothetical protein